MSKPKPDAEDKTKQHPQASENLPGAARNMDKKEPPPHTRNAPQTQHAERNTPRSKR